MKNHRLLAPSTDGALLAVPPLTEAGTLLQDNAQRLQTWDYDFQGRRAAVLRPFVRAVVLNKARAFLEASGIALPNEPKDGARLVVTGHQPELFHPGVWIKNFAASAIARSEEAVSLNLIVDNDIPKSAGLRVPKREQGVLKVDRVDFDDWAGEVPYEDLIVQNESLFATFRDRVKATLDGMIVDPIVDDLWPKVLAAKGLTDRLGLRFALGRRQIEESVGVRNLEVPLSRVCETEGFLWFASHLLAQLPRFQQVHNDALMRYRESHKIRSRHHPVPALGARGDWLEAPFWVWRVDAPRRHPLLVRQKGKTMELRIDGEDEPLIELPLGPDREACCAVEQLRELPSLGIRLRTRALTTTMFSRFLLGDLFLHGIGGAKYDELGDEIAGRFFGFEPPAYLTLSLTLRLGLGDDPATKPGLERVDRLLRDYRFNPDRYLEGLPVDDEAQVWVARKKRAILGPVETHRQRVERFQEIRRCNEALEGWTANALEDAKGERGRLVFGLQQNALAHGREFSYALHSRSHLLKKVGESLGNAPI